MDARELLARLIQCEAGGEGSDGMAAVAMVILNRARVREGEFSRVNNGGDVRAVEGIIADIGAEDGVHERASAGAAELFGRVDGDVDRGLPREPGLEEDLRGGEGDEEPHLLVDLAFSGVLDEQGIQEIFVAEILEEEGGDGGFRGEIPGTEVVQAVVEGDAVIFPGGQGGERVFQDALGNTGCLQRYAFLSSVVSGEKEAGAACSVFN